MDISPKVDFLRSIRADRGDLVRLCGEAVDNCFDADATAVAIRITDSDVMFEDNGIGIALERFESLFTLGHHGPMASTRLGRFGIGIKSQAVNVADVFEVTTVTRAGSYSAFVDWPRLVKGGEWKIADPIRLPSLVGAPTGTKIRLSSLRRLQRWSVEKIVEQLAERFYPALVDGRSITVNGVSVPLLVDPKMTDVIERDLQLASGRSARVRAGVLLAPGRLNRVHVSYGHRVIMPSSTVGCGKYTGLSNLFARVQLIGPWRLGKYKDDLPDEDERDEIEEALETVLEPILIKCGTVSISAKVATISSLINDMLPEEIAAARPRRQREKEPVSGKKRGRTGEVDRAKSDPDGPAKTRRSRRDEVVIGFEGRNEEHGIGYFQHGRPCRVDLSPDNWHVAQILNQRDDKNAASALLVIALQIFEQGRERHDPQLQIEYDNFGRRVASHLEASQPSTPDEMVGAR